MKRYLLIILLFLLAGSANAGVDSFGSILDSGFWSSADSRNFVSKYQMGAIAGTADSAQIEFQFADAGDSGYAVIYDDNSDAPNNLVAISGGDDASAGAISVFFSDENLTADAEHWLGVLYVNNDGGNDRIIRHSATGDDAGTIAYFAVEATAADPYSGTRDNNFSGAYIVVFYTTADGEVASFGRRRIILQIGNGDEQ